MRKYNVENYIRYKEDVKESMPEDKFYDYYNSNSGKDASRNHVDTKDYYINQEGIPDGSYQIIAFDASAVNGIDNTTINKISFTSTSTSTSQPTDISFADFLTLSNSSLNASALSSNLFVYVAATNTTLDPYFAIGTIYGPKHRNQFTTTYIWYNASFNSNASGAIVGQPPNMPISIQTPQSGKIFIIILIKKNNKQIKFKFNP